MQMTLDEFAAPFPNRGKPIPAEFAGEWIAWNDGRSEILAHGVELTDVRRRAVERGCARPVLQKVPHGPSVGGA
ncbi:MAG: hypothetical protein JXR94_10200 [Candidatus Hydrogenedentes bacterium]|nr:hypothetical protein [Candidatus Hydrogenedentota bacterium]